MSFLISKKLEHYYLLWYVMDRRVTCIKDRNYYKDTYRYHGKFDKAL